LGFRRTLIRISIHFRVVYFSQKPNPTTPRQSYVADFWCTLDVIKGS
jgi:hypothetical protein